VSAHANQLDHSLHVVNHSEYIRQDVQVIDKVLGHSAIHHAQTNRVSYNTAQNEIIKELGRGHIREYFPKSVFCRDKLLFKFWPNHHLLNVYPPSLVYRGIEVACLSLVHPIELFIHDSNKHTEHEHVREHYQHQEVQDYPSVFVSFRLHVNALGVNSIIHNPKPSFCHHDFKNG
jgi:hypothetical protein